MISSSISSISTLCLFTCLALHISRGVKDSAPRGALLAELIYYTILYYTIPYYTILYYTKLYYNYYAIL